MGYLWLLHIKQTKLQLTSTTGKSLSFHTASLDKIGPSLIRNLTSMFLKFFPAVSRTVSFPQTIFWRLQSFGLNTREHFDKVKYEERGCTAPPVLTSTKNICNSRNVKTLTKSSTKKRMMFSGALKMRYIQFSIFLPVRKATRGMTSEQLEFCFGQMTGKVKVNVMLTLWDCARTTPVEGWTWKHIEIRQPSEKIV